MQPSTSEEILGKQDDTVRQNGGLEPSKETDVTVVAMVDLNNDTDSEYEGKFLNVGNFQLAGSIYLFCIETRNDKYVL
jgi:hypothetical protein